MIYWRKTLSLISKHIILIMCSRLRNVKPDKMCVCELYLLFIMECIVLNCLITCICLVTVSYITTVYREQRFGHVRWRLGCSDNQAIHIHDFDCCELNLFIFLCCGWSHQTMWVYLINAIKTPDVITQDYECQQNLQIIYNGVCNVRFQRSPKPPPWQDWLCVILPSLG